MNITVRPPETEAEWELYYELRYKVLREPWAQPKGSEVLTDEETAIHAIAINELQEVLAVGRLQINSPFQAQIRCMAVATKAQGQGVGKKIMAYLEEKAKTIGQQEIILDARENAVPFYKAIGYSIFAESYLLFDEIQHWKMRKTF